MCLLPRQEHFQCVFIALDQFSAHVHGRAVERAGELEGRLRLLLVPNRRTLYVAASSPLLGRQQIS